VQETAVDLPVLLAVLSSLRDRPMAEQTIAFGEVGLSGEIRPVPNGEERLEGSRYPWLQARDRAEGQCAQGGACRRHAGDRRGTPRGGLEHACKGAPDRRHA
jgi:hypothetical protein